MQFANTSSIGGIGKNLNTTKIPRLTRLVYERLTQTWYPLLWIWPYGPRWVQIGLRLSKAGSENPSESFR
jgi:hypothetical protein